MGGLQAAKVLLQIEKASIRNTDEDLTPEEEDALLDKIESKYEEQTKPVYAAARLWTDAVIDPVKTRDWISMGIEIADEAPIEESFNLGVLQV